MNLKHDSKQVEKGKGTSPISWIYRAGIGRSDKSASVSTARREQMIKETLENESDDEDTEHSPEAIRIVNRQPASVDQKRKGGSIDSASEVTAHSALPARHLGEARIVAPNVSKLSPHSAVEVRLQSADECVAVLCSVDVLKMRSGFFHDVLCEQENNKDLSTNNGDTPELNPNVLWREAVVVPEESPFEAAAYLESLHEGRALFRGEWNFCWARLSVTWVIEDLMLEYASQIEQQMNKLVQLVEQNHWRTSPSVLAGMRVAVFRKGINPLPTIVTGVAIECLNNIGYSKLRIAFDTDKLKVPMSPGKAAHADNNSGGAFGGGPMSPPYTPRAAAAKEYAYYQSSGLTPSASSSRAKTSSLTSSTLQSAAYTSGLGHIPTPVPPVRVGGFGPSAQQQQQQQAPPDSSRSPPTVIGDVAEPFWVQSTQENSMWCDPDEFFLTSVKRKITITDKRMFWEMARALIELPELSLASHESKIRCAADLTKLLQRPEYRILWIAEAAHFLPKDVATELIRSAYVPPESTVGMINSTVER